VQHKLFIDGGRAVKFSEKEIRYLMQPHPVVETADRFGKRNALSEFTDLRLIGCPSEIFERVLESRARRLGSKFVEFRSRSLAEAPATDLDARVAGSGLF